MLNCLGGRREGDSLRSEKKFVAKEKWTQILWSLRQHNNYWATFPLLFWNLCCKPEEQFVASLLEFYNRTVWITGKESLFANSQKNQVSNNIFFLNANLQTFWIFKLKRTFQPITILLLVNLDFQTNEDKTKKVQTCQQYALWILFSERELVFCFQNLCQK